ncbi:unnamed protein product [Gulo gulo]|uniref:Uncharacterized protein n=1 Tax=Gulo gulo TaxID=48420 RepID=A0A9X9LBV8_GULGU|nr:unnamed protein product [Gulo gulo]
MGGCGCGRGPASQFQARGLRRGQRRSPMPAGLGGRATWNQKGSSHVKSERKHLAAPSNYRSVNNQLPGSRRTVKFRIERQHHADRDVNREVMFS